MDAKAAAAAAWGRVGLSDLTRGPMLPKELGGLLAWIACIADAQPVAGYVEYMRSANFDIEKVELRDEALTEMVGQIRMKLLGAEIMLPLSAFPSSGDLSIKTKTFLMSHASLRLS